MRLLFAQFDKLVMTSSEAIVSGSPDLHGRFSRAFQVINAGPSSVNLFEMFVKTFESVHDTLNFSKDSKCGPEQKETMTVDFKIRLLSLMKADLIMNLG